VWRRRPRRRPSPPGSAAPHWRAVAG